MRRVVVYAGTRNLYKDMMAATKSLLQHNKIDRVYYLIEDDHFPYTIPNLITCIDVSHQTYIRPTSPNINNWWTWMVLMRGCLTKILPDEDVILSLDVDTIVAGDITPIWDVDLEPYYFAGVREPKKSIVRPYINFGVVLYNLKKLRDGMDDCIIKELNLHHFPFPEQDLYNTACVGKILELPSAYNVTKFTEQTDEKLIYHYAGDEKRKARHLYDKYLTIPWETILH